jgi:FkbM family methyltransferase
MLFTLVKPFFVAAFKRNPAVSRFALLRALVDLALSKRFGKKTNSVRVRLGRFIIHAPDHAVASQLIKEKFVDQEYYFTATTSSPIIIDCGANIGISALYFKSLFPGAVIHCFEPYSKALYFLQKNIEENKLGNVFIHQNALSNAEGTITLHVPGSVINASLEATNPNASTEQVRAIKLSAFLQQFENIELVKIDVEGSEINILSDLEHYETLQSGKIRQFVVEFHRSMHSADQLTQFIELLKRHGYRVTSKILFPKNQVSDVMIYAVKS